MRSISLTPCGDSPGFDISIKEFGRRIGAPTFEIIQDILMVGFDGPLRCSNTFNPEYSTSLYQSASFLNAIILAVLLKKMPFS